jgi:hypothetical protein
MVRQFIPPLVRSRYEGLARTKERAPIGLALRWTASAAVWEE